MTVRGRLCVGGSLPLRTKQSTAADIFLAMGDMRVNMAGGRDVSQGLYLETSKGFPIVGAQSFGYLLE